ncbi:MAG TPA: C-GCAxxG-C-C family protein [Syntrophales bacterium]|nr:C-GCAxxG-C-C family protein [Syntrophales bacterium]HPQ45317.1 C-GCAxxG-C-C family protein [Syntrophales bacterium]
MNDQDIRKKAYKKGFQFEREYHGCAQCVVGALYEIFPELRNGDIFRSASGLAAGTGLTTKGQCGGLSGAVMVISQIRGREIAEMADPEGKRFVAHRLAEKMVDHFTREFGTVTCGEIQKKLMGRIFYLKDPEQHQAFEDAGGHSHVCPHVVGMATSWAAELIQREIGND